MLEQQHFGEEILILRARLQLAHGLVADFQQLRARHRVLVFLEPLQNEFLIFLLERPRCTTHRCHAGLARLLEREGRQHGSTCTVTASSSRSFFSCASDRKSTRLNSSHRCISYAVFCLKERKDEIK